MTVLDPFSTWEDEAQVARMEQAPLRARRLLWGAVAIVVLLVIWSAYAEIDEVTRGQGRVIPSGQVQVIQAVDGGVISAILTAEGQVVAPGQTLLKIDPVRFLASLRENQAQTQPLEIRAERLKALSETRAFAPSPELVSAAPELVERERTLFRSSQEALASQLQIIDQQVEQRGEELNEAIARRDQARRSFELAEQEFQVTSPLLRSGAVSQIEVLRLEKEVTRNRGELEQAQANVKRVEAAMGETREKRQELLLNFRNDVRKELSEVAAKLSALAESGKALEDKVRQTEVKSPVRATVKRMFVNTLGGVVQPGQEVVELLPLDEALVLEVQIKPQDIAFLRPGQHAMVKFSAYDFAIYGGMSASLESIGADSILDDKGNAFYLVRIRTDAAQLGENLPIIPGMLADVDIITGKKTVLTYLMKPVLRAKANALTER
ncbi:MAG: HlyD family type I secretion periplasmic adaptor subunit [Hahellaceae bacterium]|nr:HlyD family type I secretion periplasmic adaptor subunit [Hahellaceae bacterium]